MTLGSLNSGLRLLALLHRQFQGLQLERDACLASNYALAKENLALRPRLEMGRTALAIKYQELREVAENCADKLQRLGEGRPRRLAWGGVGFNLCQVLKGGAGTHLLLLEGNVKGVLVLASRKSEVVSCGVAGVENWAGSPHCVSSRDSGGRGRRITKLPAALGYVVSA